MKQGMFQSFLVILLLNVRQVAHSYVAIAYGPAFVSTPLGLLAFSDFEYKHGCLFL